MTRYKPIRMPLAPTRNRITSSRSFARATFTSGGMICSTETAAPTPMLMRPGRILLSCPPLDFLKLAISDNATSSVISLRSFLFSVATSR